MNNFKSNPVAKAVGLLVFLMVFSVVIFKVTRKQIQIPKLEDEAKIEKVLKEPFTELIPAYGIVLRGGVDLQVEVAIDANDASKVFIGSKAAIHSSRFQKPVMGKVVRLIRNASSETNQSVCWIVANNSGLSLKSGDFVWAKIELTTGNPVLVVPTQAILVKEGKSWVITPDKKAKEVKIGRSNDERVEILSGLTEQDSVMTEGAIAYLYSDFKAAGGD